jgi:hypothetical protein
VNAPARLLPGEAPVGYALTGVLAGIARHAYPKAPMEVLTEAMVTIEAGISGDFRGAVKPGGKGRRQVTLMERGDWDAAMRELGHSVPWSTTSICRRSRARLYVSAPMWCWR